MAALTNVAWLTMRRTMSTKTPMNWAEHTKTITRADLDEFARLTGDTNPIHLAGEQPVVHGALLLGLVSGVAGTRCPGAGSVVISLEAKFLNPCPVGSSVKVRVEQISDRKISDCVFRCEESDGGGGRLLAEGTLRVAKRTRT